MRAFAVVLLALGALAVLAGQLAGGAEAAWPMAAGIAGSVTALMLFGVAAMREGGARRGALAVVVAMGCVLAVSVLGIVALSADGEGGAWLGASPGLVVLLAGVWLVPLVLVGIGHGLTFDRPRHEEERDPERPAGRS
jgi:hypothetical protein